MDSSKIWYMILLVVMTATFITTLASKEEENDVSGFNFLQNKEGSLRGTSRILAQSPRGVMTCDKYPRVCAAKGSRGPHCCNKQCVNVETDRLNCGKCGKKCGYSQICCQGECLNPSADEKHCGRCNNRCQSGSSCVYGMCSYS